MSFRTKLLSLVDIVLRVPPLVCLDEICRGGFGVNVEYKLNPAQSFVSFYYAAEEAAAAATTTGPVRALTMDSADSGSDESAADDKDSYRVIVFSLFRLLLSVLGCLISLGIFMIRRKQLIHVYMFVLSLTCIFLSHFFNEGFVQQIVETLSQYGAGSLLTVVISKTTTVSFLFDERLLYTIGINLVIQIGLAFFFLKVHLGPYYKTLNALIPLSFLAPSFLILFSLPSSIQSHLPVFSALLPLALINYAFISSIYTILSTVTHAYQRAKTFITNFGLSALLEQEWNRLNVPIVLRLYWILRVSEQALTIYFFGLTQGEEHVDDPTGWMVIKHLLVTGCETMVAVLGMTSVISLICQYVGALFQKILQTEDTDDKSIGTVSAILFYILALQTGLTELEPEDRFVRLCRNFCLLFTALLHFIHNIVNPLLMSLSASHNPALHRHVRALVVCFFLIVYPSALLFFLWKHLQISTWLLAVSAFSTEVIVKVTVSLMIYTLFLLDAWRETFWEELDDYVYYIRAVGNTIEFCFGIFLFFNGAWSLLFESGGGVRAAMMCIHAYFNIWCEAKNGWVVFMKRKTAVQKINSLPEASAAQLQEFDDVCAICYQDMTAAKITRCNHLFHGVCLRKWLYVQDRCPLCHEILYCVKPNDVNDKSNNIIVYMQRDRDRHSHANSPPLPTTSQSEDGSGSSEQSSTLSTKEQGSQTDDVEEETSSSRRRQASSLIELSSDDVDEVRSPSSSSSSSDDVDTRSNVRHRSVSSTNVRLAQGPSVLEDPSSILFNAIHQSTLVRSESLDDS